MLSSLLLLGSTLVAPQSPFSDSFAVAEPTRLAITPTIDGKHEAEEWDPIATGPNWFAALQWEPRKLHVGGKMPKGQDLLISIDRKNDGWLKGSDNLEIRLSWVDGKVKVGTRSVDGTKKEGPMFVAQPGFEMAAITAGEEVSSTEGEGAWNFEATLEDPNVGYFPLDQASMAIRMDLVPSDRVVSEPYFPRSVTPIRFEFDRDQALPVGLKFKPEGRGRVVIPGSETKMRFTFEGSNSIGIKEFSLRPEGALQEQLARMVLPFPRFDNKGRAFVDYPTQARTDLKPGYRVMRGTIELNEGPPAITQTSFLVPPMLDFDIPEVPVDVKGKAHSKRFPLYIKSYVKGRVDGKYTVKVPAEWTLAKEDQEQKFVIYNTAGRIRRVFEVQLPPNTAGTFPVEISAQVGKESYTRRLWITISG